MIVRNHPERACTLDLPGPTRWMEERYRDRCRRSCRVRCLGAAAPCRKAWSRGERTARMRRTIAGPAGYRGTGPAWRGSKAPSSKMRTRCNRLAAASRIRERPPIRDRCGPTLHRVRRDGVHRRPARASPAARPIRSGTGTAMLPRRPRPAREGRGRRAGSGPVSDGSAPDQYIAAAGEVAIGLPPGARICSGRGIYPGRGMFPGPDRFPTPDQFPGPLLRDADHASSGDNAARITTSPACPRVR